MNHLVMCDCVECTIRAYERRVKELETRIMEYRLRIMKLRAGEL